MRSAVRARASTWSAPAINRGFTGCVRYHRGTPNTALEDNTRLAQLKTLMRRHHIRPGDTKDFDVRNLSQIAEAAEGSSRIMALLLATVASISLVA